MCGYCWGMNPPIERGRPLPNSGWIVSTQSTSQSEQTP